MIYNSFNEIIDLINGKETENSDITIKMDGSVSIVMGIHPLENKFFISTKSFFNKTPKYATSIEQIYEVFGERNLSDRLVTIFTAYHNLEFPQIIQGDVLFIKDQLDICTISNKIKFTGNILSYSTDLNSDIGNSVINSKVGIAWHTAYNNDFQIEHLRSIPESVDTFNFDCQLSEITSPIIDEDQMKSSIKNLFKEYYYHIDNIVFSKDHIAFFKQFHNYLVRGGKHFNKIDIFKNLLLFISSQRKKELSKYKTDKKIQEVYNKYENMIEFIRLNKMNLIRFYELFVIVSNTKESLIRLLDKRSLFEVSFDNNRVSHEGYVYKTSSHIVKLVNRSEFSYNNFNYWENKNEQIHRKS